MGAPLKEITIRRRPDALGWVPMRIRVNKGGFEKVGPNTPAVLKTKGAPEVFIVRMVGMKKELKVPKKDRKHQSYTVGIGSDTNTAFGVLLGVLLAVSIFIMGFRANPMSIGLMAGGLILVPILLTALYGRISIEPYTEEEM